MSTQFSVRLVDGGFYSTYGTSIPANSGVNFEIEFDVPFVRIPNVQITPFFSSESASTVQSMAVGLTGNTTTSGCTVRVVNNSDSAKTLLGFTWFAVQLPLMVEG